MRPSVSCVDPICVIIRVFKYIVFVCGRLVLTQLDIRRKVAHSDF